MKIALAQVNSGSDWKKNLDVTERLIQKAARQSAQAVLFPENAFFMGRPGQLKGISSELERAGVVGEIAQMAQTFRISVFLGGLPEPIRNSKKVFNTAIWIEETGKVAARYRKIHLFDVRTPQGKQYRESLHVKPGKREIVFPWKKMKMGLTICYDLRFPEQFQRLAQKGATCIVVPAAFTRETGKAHWHTLLHARAIENLCYILAPAQTGTHPYGRKTYGHSLAVDPWGEALCDGGTRLGLSYVELDPVRVTKLRRRFRGLERLGSAAT